MFAKLPKLETLFLSSMDYITDEELKDFTTLKRLECHHCSKIQNEGLCTAVQMCENIEKIYISDDERSIELDIDFLKFTIGVLKSRNNNNQLEVRINDCIVRIAPNKRRNDQIANLLFEIVDKEEKVYLSTFDEEELLKKIEELL